MENRFLNRAIRNSFEVGGSAGPTACPGESMLAAYLEHGLAEAEAARIEDHVSNCCTCQEILALALRLQTQESSEAADTATPPVRSRGFFGLWKPVPALAVLAMTLTAGGLLFHYFRQEFSPAVTETSALGSPEGIRAEAESLGRTDSRQAKALDASARSPMNEPPTSPASKREDAATAPRIGAVHKAEPIPADKTREGTKDEAATSEKEMLDKLAVTQTPAASREFRVATAPAAPPEPKTAETREAKGGLQPPAEPAAEVTRVRRIGLAQAPGAVVQSEAGRFAAAGAAVLPSDAIRAAVEEVALPAGAAAKKELGSRSFYQILGYWIDGQCTKDPEGQVIEIARDSEEYLQVVEELPELLDLLRSEIPILLRWKERNCLLR